MEDRENGGPMAHQPAREFTSRVFYPNPFIPAGIEFELPEEADVSLVIFDGAGNEVKTLMERRRFPAGVHQLSVDLPDAGGGKYFYRLSAAYGDDPGGAPGGRSFVEVKRL
jgi:hypothetical protein